MTLKNTPSSYGIVSILLHWIMALLVVSVFILGLYIVEMDYYNPWYRIAPEWHKILGIVVFVLLGIRVIWHKINTKPLPLTQLSQWEKQAAYIVHTGFYITLFIVCLTGYFITTGKGASIELLNWIKIPAMITVSQHSMDLMGNIHRVTAWIICFLFFIHVIATIKHQLIHKDATLKRMLIPMNTKKQG